LAVTGQADHPRQSQRQADAGDRNPIHRHAAAFSAKDREPAADAEQTDGQVYQHREPDQEGVLLDHPQQQGEQHRLPEPNHREDHVQNDHDLSERGQPRFGEAAREAHEGLRGKADTKLRGAAGA
jgi:hypothetical protein